MNDGMLIRTIIYLTIVNAHNMGWRVKKLEEKRYELTKPIVPEMGHFSLCGFMDTLLPGE